MEKKMSDSLFLSLGQIIKINAPENGELNNKVFMINYIDKTIVELLEQNSLEKKVLNIKEGFLTEESIESIMVLYKPEKEGFARQNDLMVNRYITIEFGGEVPTIINGKITNLEEDRIEITSYPDNQVFYIDFEYKGIPRDLPIKSIKDFVLPKKTDVEEEVEEGEIVESKEGEIKDGEIKEAEIKEGETKETLQEKDISIEEEVEEDADFKPTEKVNLEEDLIDMQDIEFLDEELEEISEEIEVSEGEKVYDITDQVSDLMDDLLASVPTSRRTPKFLKHVHTMLERYKELRQEYSTFDELGYFSKTKFKTENYKPVKKVLHDMNDSLYWALPVVTNKKHIYFRPHTFYESDDFKSRLAGNYITDTMELNNNYQSNTIPDEQNKYDYFYKNLDLDSYDKPDTNDYVYTSDSYNNNVIVEHTNDFNSYTTSIDKLLQISVVRENRFVIDKTTAGLSKIKPSSAKRPGCPKTLQPDTEREAITTNDKAYVKGVITLPYDMMQYSKIYDINNSILTRVNYHADQIHYSEILNKDTEVLFNDMNTPVDIFNNVVYHFANTESFENKEDAWEAIKDNVALNANNLFKTLQSEIENGVSLDRVCNYFNPYKIYKNDLVYKDYLLIKEFIEGEIKSYKKGKINNIIKYNNYLKFIKNYKKISFLDKYIASEDIKKLYGIDKETDVQLLNKMYLLDDGRLLMEIIAREIHDDLKEEVSDLNPEVLMELKKELSEKDIDNKECEPVNNEISLSKKYFELDDLLQDNNKNVLYDKKYDTTRYDIADDLLKEQEMTYEDLVEHLVKNVGVKQNVAEVDARSMLDGYKSVQEGDYAILEPNGYELHYYIRRDNKWVLDEKMENKSIEEMGFCNLKQSCLKINETCMNKENQENAVKEMTVDELIKHYEDSQAESREKVNKKIAEKIESSKVLASLLKNVNKLRNLKYDIQKINIGKMLTSQEVTVSPYEKLKNRILGEYDIASKMNHILTFVNSYCRTSIKDESPHWYYCIETSVPLLPTFYNDLAIGFQTGHYIEALKEIEKARGTSDGDNIVDKYSGYVIKKLQYDENEGYEASGFKRVTREIMEEEEDIVMSASVSTLESNKKHMGFVKDITKKLKTLDTKLKINTKQQHDFIIKYMIMFMKKYVLSEKKFMAKTSKNKGKAPSYKKYKDEIKIFLLIGLYIIGIQLLTPHLDYAPTFEGCVMSFDGFPLEEGGDNSIVSYIVCLFLKLKSSIRPWNVLPSTRRSNFNEVKDKFVEKIVKFMKTKILTEVDIVNKLEEKREWMILNMQLVEGSKEFDIKQWETFLPHLNKVNVEDTRGISNNFDRLLSESIAKGNISQFSYIFSLMGKVINQSFLIQEDMERVVGNKQLILNTLNNIPFLENACCNETKNNFNYFVDKEPLIIERNNEIKSMMEKYERYRKLTKAPFLYSDKNTKLIYPTIDTNYSEDTIYLSFIKYCKYNTGAILDDELQRLCVTNESSFNKYDSLSEKIKKMKQEEGNYSSESLVELLRIISKRNIINQGFSNVNISPKVEFESNLHDQTILDLEIIESLKTVLDNFDLVYTEDIDNDVNDLILLIKQKNTELSSELQNHIKKTKAKKKTLTEFLSNIEDFKQRKGSEYVTDKDETTLFSIEYLKKVLFNVCIQYPQLILGNVKYSKINENMPKHWKFSLYHNNKLGEVIKKEVGKFAQYSDDEEVLSLLRNVVNKNKSLYEFSKIIPIYSDIVGQSSIKKSVLNTTISQVIYKHLLLKSMINFIDVEETIKINKPFDNPDIEENVFEESNETLKEKMGEIMTIILDVFQYQKSTINLSMEEIQNNVLNTKETEKTGVVERLKNMSKEDRKSEDYMKNLRLGDWNLGQTKALYIYDPEQYDREVEEENKKNNMRNVVENRQIEQDGVANPFQQEVMMDEMMREEAENMMVQQENMQDMMQMGEDDDFGEMDGDEMY